MELKRQGERLHRVQGGEREERAALVSSGDLHTEAKDHFPLTEERKIQGGGGFISGIAMCEGDKHKGKTLVVETKSEVDKGTR